MSRTLVIFRRELTGYFSTPVAYVFLVVFLILSGVFCWHFGSFYTNDRADLSAFFFYHPIVYLALIPALTMRLWSEERRSGTIESLLTLPVSMGEAVLGKFLAAWVFTAVALALTVTEWITVSYLGDPDHGVIVAAYVGSFLMAGGFLAVGSCLSALTKNQVIAFVLSLITILILIMSGYPMVLDVLPDWTPTIVVDALRSLSSWTHYQQISRGVLDLRDILYFVSLIAVALFANAIVVDLKKAA
jgi:ABC-2 type transport system permease protein